MPNSPVYTIGIVSELLDVHPETLRIWERNGIVRPRRRSGKRFYSQNDLKRLRFIKRLIAENLNLPAIRFYLQFYPCWQSDDCPCCMRSSRSATCGKPCWKEEGASCLATGGEDTGSKCEFYHGLEQEEACK